jgi:hypothetical protein
MTREGTSSAMKARSWTKGALALLLAGAAAVLPAQGADAAHRAPAGKVFVIQGVPGASVDVTIDGKTVDTGAEAKAVLGPVSLTDGRHTITFSSDQWTVTSSFQVHTRSSDIVLHWPAEIGPKPETTVFKNDIAPVAAGKGRLTVAHTAVVPPADVRVDQKVLFSNIANGEFVSAQVPAGTYSVDIVPTGQDTDPLLGPVDLPVKGGVLTRVFAIGQPTNGSMDAIVQVLPLRQTGSKAPSQVEAGSAGLVAVPNVPAPNDSTGSAAGLAGAVAGIAALAGLLMFLAARRRGLVG